MDNLTKFEENREWNAYFLRAFDYLCKEKSLKQFQLAKKMNTNSSLISAYRKGTKRANEDIMQRLCEAYEGRLFKPYLTGESKYMLIASMSDKVFLEERRRIFDPDYDAIKEQDTNSESNIIELAASLIKEVEGLRQELTAEREALKEERAQLQQIILQLKAFKYPNPYLPTSPQYLASAEPK